MTIQQSFGGRPLENLTITERHYKAIMAGCDQFGMINDKPLAEAIIVANGKQTQAALDIITGTVEPSGMLTLQQPANMETVVAQYEDTPHDMDYYVDENGYTYDFGFGLCWDCEIGVDTKDNRYDKYVAVYRDDNGGSSSESVESQSSSTTSASSSESANLTPQLLCSSTGEFLLALSP